MGKTEDGNYLWLILIRVDRRVKREVRVMAPDEKAAHKEVKRQFPAAHIISWRQVGRLEAFAELRKKDLYRAKFGVFHRPTNTGPKCVGTIEDCKAYLASYPMPIQEFDIVEFIPE